MAAAADHSRAATAVASDRPLSPPRHRTGSSGVHEHLAEAAAADGSPARPVELDHTVIGELSEAVRRPELFSAVKTCVGLDIGGSLAKIVCFFDDSTANQVNPVKNFLSASKTYGQAGVRDEALAFYAPKLHGTFMFLRYLSSTTAGAVELIKENDLHQYIHKLCATGGGAFKYAPLIEQELGLEFLKVDELNALVKGLCFMLLHCPDECYTLTRVAFREAHPVAVPKTYEEIPYPFLVVNIGSGVSIIKVTSVGVFERVSGTALGGATMWGLARLMTNCKTFDEVMTVAQHGDASKVNQLVRDIYGGDYTKLGLPGDFTASFFGKMTTADKSDVNEADICLALTVMLAQNVTQIAYLIAMLHGTERIFFTGGFLRTNDIALRTLAYSLARWSKGRMEALFLRHEVYLGAMGALLETISGQEDLKLDVGDITVRDTAAPEEPASMHAEPHTSPVHTSLPAGAPAGSDDAHADTDGALK